MKDVDQNAMGVGIALGVVFGLLFDNIALGLCFGIIFGAIASQRKKGDDSE